MKAVILCGGSGTRLWPLSRTSSPKQFVPIFEDQSLFKLTIERNKHLVDGFIIVVNEKQLPLCKEQVPADLKDKTQFIIEPSARNTAPAITLAALLAKEEDLLVLPSDHLIKDPEIYKGCIESAQALASEKNLVTFGITAKYPETGYGYIEADGTNVLSFKEKPDHKTAVTYVAAGNYFWNSGMFLFNSSTFLSELEKFQPEMLQKATTAFENIKKEDTVNFVQKTDMDAIPSESIDYAVMENSQCVKVVPSPFYWSDLGSFDSLYDVLPKTEAGNAANTEHFELNSHNNLIVGGKRVIATFDIDDLIIVDTEDALLVGKKGESQKVKELLAKVKEKRSDLLE